MLVTRSFRATILTAATAIAAAAVLTGCGDPRLDKLSLGMNQDGAATAIGDKPHRTAAYLTSGKSWAVQFYSVNPVADRDSVDWRKMSPVVFIDNKAVGWGWSWWGNEAKKVNIAMPEK